MKKIAIIIILGIAVGVYFLMFNQNNIPTCSSAKVKVSSLVKNILGQTSSQKSITFEVSDIQESIVYEHSRICKAKLNFEDGTNTSISYAVESGKLGQTEVRIIPGG
jgi:hypothetical protein